MRLVELIEPHRSVEATSRFKKEMLSEIRTDMDRLELLESFLNFRKVARPDVPYNRKDYAFRFGDLKGFRHCHLVFGKSIIVYSVTPKAVLLIAWTDHSEYDGHSPKIAPYLKGLTQSDFAPLHLPSPAPASLDPEAVAELKELLYSLSTGEDRQTLVDAARGNFAELYRITKFIPMADADVIAAFGSEAGLKAFAAKILRDTKQS